MEQIDSQDVIRYKGYRFPSNMLRVDQNKLALAGFYFCGVYIFYMVSNQVDDMSNDYYRDAPPPYERFIDYCGAIRSRA